MSAFQPGCGLARDPRERGGFSSLRSQLAKASCVSSRASPGGVPGAAACCWYCRVAALRHGAVVRHVRIAKSATSGSPVLLMPVAMFSAWLRGALVAFATEFYKGGLKLKVTLDPHGALRGYAFGLRARLRPTKHWTKYRNKVWALDRILRPLGLPMYRMANSLSLGGSDPTLNLKVAAVQVMVTLACSVCC